MKKNILCALAAAVMLSGMLPAEPFNYITGELMSVSANETVISGKCGENVEWSLDTDGTITFSGKGEMYDYEGYNSVPWSEWRDSIVKAVFEDGIENIGSYAFYSFPNLKEVYIPETVSSIGECSFSMCSKIEELSIPEGVECIKNCAFGYCRNLKTIEIPESLTDISDNIFIDTKWLYNYYTNENKQFLIINGILLANNNLKGDVIIPDGVVKIANDVFWGNSVITSIYMPDSVKSIGSSVFGGCINLSEIHFSKNLERVGEYAFSGTKWLSDKKDEGGFIIENGFLFYADNCKGDVVIPDNVTHICDSVFKRCYDIKSVTFPDSVKYIGKYAFFDCDSIISISLPKELTEIDDSAFGNCFNLKEIDIPENIKTIGKYAFYQCFSLHSISLPESLEVIDDYAFNLCGGLKELYIPKNVNKIGTNIVLQDRSMERINVSEENKYFCDVDGVLFNYSKTHLLAYPGKKSDITYTIPDSVKEIKKEAFSSTLLEEVIIPESVDHIENEAFRAASCIKNLKVSSDNKTYIDIDGVLCDKDKKTLISYALGRTNKSYNVPEGIENIEKYAFFSSELTAVTLPDSLKIISDYSFENCSKLKKIEIPVGCVLIENGAFLNDDSLAKIVIPGDISFISNAAFQYCGKAVIYGYKDSYAEKYASDNKIPFVDLDTVEPENELQGDLSGDGAVNAQDLVLLLKILLNMETGLSEEQLEAADMNYDGKVNVMDLIHLKQLLFE